MNLDWSEKSPHIRTLYRPWQIGDGYEEADLVAAEAKLGIRLPAPLRSFYRAWGRRDDLTSTYEVLVLPDDLVLKEVLIFCTENQAVWYWGIPREALQEANPPIVIASAGQEPSFREVEGPLDWKPSHAHLTDFLDDLTYQHAFAGGAIHGGYTDAGGAIHGGYTDFLPLQYQQIAWLEQQWEKTTVSGLCFKLKPGTLRERLTLYVREGQALAWFCGWNAAVRDAEALGEMGQALQIIWEHQW